MSINHQDQIDTVVIGGGQAGLAAGYYLRQRDVPFMILDANQRVGDAWRKRWDSLRLFTPARYSGLPGMAVPGSPSSYPSKDDMANYLENYAEHFELPVRLGVEVERLGRSADLFEIVCGDESLLARNVIVTTGPYHHPRIPEFASELDAGILQLHSSQYQRPDQIRDGGVLVVGAANSGAEIALDLAPHRRVWLSGRPAGHEPTRAGSFLDRLFTPIMWLAATRVLRVDTPIGRKVRDQFLDPPRGIPLGRIREKDFHAAGIERVPRTEGVRDGYPLLEDGRLLEVENVVWCTGFRSAFDWIDLSLSTHNGVPVHERGVVESCPGLYFLGLMFLYSLSSALVGGVGRDAEYVVDHLISTRSPARVGTADRRTAR